MHLTDVHKYGRHPHVGRKDYQRLYGKYLKWISVTDSESVPVDPSLPSSPENVMDATEPEYDEEEDEEEEDEEFLPPLRSRRNKRRAPPSPVIQQPPTRAQRMRMRERQQEPTQALTYSSQRRKATIETPPPSNDPPSSDMVIEKILIQRIKSLLDRRFGPSSR